MTDNRMLISTGSLTRESLAWDYIDKEPGYSRADVEGMLSNQIEQCDNCGQ